mgnify:CR=1 FL=1
MLDSDAPSGATSESPENAPAPRRRRRAATRPAGPPAPVAPPVAIVVTKAKAGNSGWLVAGVQALQ